MKHITWILVDKKCLQFPLFSGQFCFGRIRGLISCKLLVMTVKDPSFMLHVILPMLFNKDQAKLLVVDRHTETVADSHRHKQIKMSDFKKTKI